MGPKGIQKLHEDLFAPLGVDRSKWLPLFWEEDASHGVTEIGLERTSCFGPCPVYTVILRDDGSVHYYGDAYVRRLGEHWGKVPPTDFNRLAWFIVQSGYFDLEHRYDFGDGVVTDAPTFYTTVVRFAQRKIVSNHNGGGPALLWAVEELIDALCRSAKWNPSASSADTLKRD